jgi:formylmethanofuran dehydrogenase subunit E
VDPDDVTRQALVDAGATDIRHGLPVLPGANSLIATIHHDGASAQALGVPACGLYFSTTAFDLLLPRLLAGVEPDRAEMAAMSHGGLCQECEACTFPHCPFGKN